MEQILIKINYSDIEQQLKQVFHSISIDTLTNEFKLDEVLYNVGKITNSQDIIQLSKNFICIDYDEYETFTMINRNYLVEMFKKNLKTLEHSYFEELLRYNCVIHLQREIEENINIEKNKKILDNNTELSSLINDLKLYEKMELYYEIFDEIFNTIFCGERYMITPFLLDFLLDEVICVLFEPFLYLEEKEKYNLISY